VRSFGDVLTWHEEFARRVSEFQARQQTICFCYAYGGAPSCATGQPSINVTQKPAIDGFVPEQIKKSEARVRYLATCERLILFNIFDFEDASVRFM
jgi:hypothetical protein